LFIDLWSNWGETTWEGTNGNKLDENFLTGRWAEGQPDGKTEDGKEIDIAYAIMDPNGKLKDENGFSDYNMCICEYEIP
jgi:hypothetical protein